MGSCVDDHSNAVPILADCVDSVIEGDDWGIAIEGCGAGSTVTVDGSITDGRIVVPFVSAVVGGVFRFRQPGLGPGFPACEGYTHCLPNFAQASHIGVTRLPIPHSQQQTLAKAVVKGILTFCFPSTKLVSTHSTDRGYRLQASQAKRTFSLSSR